MRGEEEGDSDEMMLKGNEGAEGEETLHACAPGEPAPCRFT